MKRLQGERPAGKRRRSEQGEPGRGRKYEGTEASRRRMAARKRKKQRQRRRKALQAWLMRLLAFAVAAVLLSLALQGGAYLWRHLNGSGSGDAREAISWFSGDEGEQDADGMLVVLDAGHGGKDQGTSHGNILEKDINLKVAKLVAEELQKNGIRVLLTREDDSRMELEARAELANEKAAGLFVSIHCNYCEEDADVEGLECYYMEGSAEGEALAQEIIAGFASAEEVVNRGTRTADFRVLRLTDMPAALVELGYISNVRERELLTQKKYQETLAECIARSILNYGN